MRALLALWPIRVDLFALESRLLDPLQAEGSQCQANCAVAGWTDLPNRVGW